MSQKSLDSPNGRKALLSERIPAPPSRAEGEGDLGVPAAPPKPAPPVTGKPTGVTERIRKKLKELLDDDPNIYPLY
jgi:hypothetical protein